MSGKKRNTSGMIGMIAGVIMLVVLIPVLLLNTVIIVRGMMFSEDPPSVFGFTPLAVMTGSMEDYPGNEFTELTFNKGSVIVLTTCDTAGLKPGDVVTYKDKKYDPKTEEYVYTGTFTTHRILEITENGYVTKGDWNNTQDQPTRPYVLPEDVVGQYKGLHMDRLAYLFDFATKPVGILVIIGIPVALFVAHDIFRRQKQSKKSAGKEAALEAEIERLKLLAGEKSADTEFTGADEKPTETGSD